MRFDRLRDTQHGIDRARGVALQRLDLPGDLLGGVLGLHRQRLHLGGDDGETAPGLAGARGLDGGIERQQRRLPGDLRDQVDDIADRRRGFPQAIHIGAGFARGFAGLVGELAGVADLGADPLRRMRELVGGVRKGRRRALRVRSPAGQRIGALADGGKRGRGRFGAAGDRIGRALELADHPAKFEFQQFKDRLGGIALDGLGRGRSLRSLVFRGRRGGLRHLLLEHTERHGISWKLRKDRKSSHPSMKSGLTTA